MVNSLGVILRIPVVNVEHSVGISFGVARLSVA